MRVEPFDGYMNIANARWFLGLAADYQEMRFPGMALAMVPSEWLKGALGLHPLDVRPHHAMMALLHAAYLVAVYRGLTAVWGRSPSSLLAFAGVALNLMFFALAPFINSDLLMGAVLLWMVIALDRFLAQPRAGPWVALVVLGCVAASVKPIFASFWVAVLLAAALALGLDRPPLRTGLRRFAALAAGAACSALGTWSLEAAALGGVVPQVAFWERPTLILAEMRRLALSGENLELYTPSWVYLRNAWAYGGLLVAGAIGGGLLSLRRGLRPVERITWVVLVSFLAVSQFTPYKEVRYLAVLLPLLALPARVAIHAALGSRKGVAVVVGLLAFDAASALPQAGRIAEPFYRESALRQFLAPLADGRRPIRVLWAGGYLTFAAPGPSPLAGDAFFGLFHFGPQLLRVLYAMGPDQVVKVPRHETLLRTLSDPRAGAVRALPRSELFPRLDASGHPFSVAIAVSHRLVNPPTWEPALPAHRDGFWQGIAILDPDARATRRLRLQRQCDYGPDGGTFRCNRAR